MEKYLLKLELRYSDAPKEVDGHTTRNKIITIGVYDNFDDACINGNALLIKLEGRFDKHTFPNGSKASSERFSKNGGCFGGKNDLVTNLAYLKTPFEFYAKIETLKYDNIDESIDEVVNA